MDITLELDTRYHERQKKKGGHQEKNPPVTGSNSSRPPQDSSTKRPHHKKNKKARFINYDSGHEDSSGVKSSASNSLAIAVNSVALVGEFKTPSLPSSAHIPSIMPSQSLLKSRDEVFKEMKDVVDDVATSSLHLFQGDMDLPPLSFHPSLEEQWDKEEEPEEIETLLKVVPPSYQ
ncbi:hypothetical protein O181_048098 [Austropuccinia psidii MF-1]|uniref:Uncharacterized protein n=1 Tax=Austropuccinia psidii MF-1 TaxID=1389203 RepID=A0A9Q3DV59_9BASI|nr:hypothetical protein [Austropuccinia psidii MF-1]